MTRIHLWNFLTLKICNFIAMRFYFGSQNIFAIDRLTIKFFFDMSTDVIPNSIKVNKSLSSFKKYIHFVCPSYFFIYAFVLGSIMCNDLTL